MPKQGASVQLCHPRIKQQPVWRFLVDARKDAAPVRNGFHVMSAPRETGSDPTGNLVRLGNEQYSHEASFA
ncbi:MAG: hypothetical protein AMXMBFR22_10510 [Phycisphaerae bacterium]